MIIRRSILTSIWSDPWFELLPPNSKLIFLYLITNSKTNMLGIYEASIKKISNETDIDREEVKSIIESFKADNKIQLHESFIIVTNFIKHQKMNPNMKKSALKVYQNLPHEMKQKDLILSRNYNKTVKERQDIESDFETLCKGYGIFTENSETLSKGLPISDKKEETLPKKEKEEEEEKEKEKEEEEEYEGEEEKELKGRSTEPTKSPLPFISFESITAKAYVEVYKRRINQLDRIAITELGELLEVKIPQSSPDAKSSALFLMIKKLEKHRFWSEKRHSIQYLAKNFEEAWNIAMPTTAANPVSSGIDYSKYETA